jgi:uncharacterized protein involved in exopolysaccharide biosynthesis
MCANARLEQSIKELKHVYMEQNEKIIDLTNDLQALDEKVVAEITKVTEEIGCTRVEFQKEAKELREENKQQTEEIKRINETHQQDKASL